MRRKNMILILRSTKVNFRDVHEKGEGMLARTSTAKVVIPNKANSAYFIKMPEKVTWKRKVRRGRRREIYQLRALFALLERL